MESSAEESENALVELENRGGAVIARILESEVTMFALPEIRQTLDQVLVQQPELLVLDFSASSFLDSSGLGMIFQLQQRIEAYGGRFAVCGLRSSLRRVLDAVVKRGEIQFFDTAEQAIKQA